MGVSLSVYRYIDIFTSVFQNVSLTHSTLVVTSYLLRIYYAITVYLTRSSVVRGPTGTLAPRLEEIYL